jgi:hypothetical protein
VERRFRRNALLHPPPAAAAPSPIKLAVTNLTLLPRFTIIWQDWHRAVLRLERLEYGVWGEMPRAPREMRREKALVRERAVPRERAESPVERASRLPLERRFRGALPSIRGVRSGGAHGLEGPSPERTSVRIARQRHPLPWLETDASRFARRSILLATERVQTVFERLGSRTSRLVKSTVTRRHVRFLDRETRQRIWSASPSGPEHPVAHGATRAEPPSIAQVYPPRHAALGPPVSSGTTRSQSPPTAQGYPPRQATQGPAGAHSAAGRADPPAQRVLPPQRTDPSRVTGPKDRPAERVFRTQKSAAQPVSPAPVPATPAPQAAPIDIGKLDTLLWQRFEKRLRIERERRGRA